MVNIFDSVNNVARDLQETPEYKAVQEAINTLKGNADDLKFYQEVVQFQQELQMKQMQGQEVTPEDDAKFNEYSKQMNDNKNIADLMAKEQAMFQLLQQIQTAMTQPLDQMYAELNK